MIKSFKSISLSLCIRYWEFRPSLLSSLTFILLLPLLLSLGFWQWHRAETKQQLMDQFALRSQQAAQPLAEDLPIYTPAEVTGSYDRTHPILLDNRIINHRLGYDVFLPFIQSDDQPVVLVNLGWIPKSDQESYQALITAKLPPATPLTITGLVQKVQNNLVLSHPQVRTRWPLIVEDIQFESLKQILNRPFYPFILLLSSEGGFQKHWDKVTTITPERHRGYAIQWFGLAFALFILYFKLNIRRRS